jgi:hypothetical protein
MSTAAPPVVMDGAPQTQELDDLRKQLADLQVSRTGGLMAPRRPPVMSVAWQPWEAIGEAAGMKCV